MAAAGKTMRAFGVSGKYAGNASTDTVALTLPVPVPKDGDLLVEIKATATNPIDFKVLDNFGAGGELPEAKDNKGDRTLVAGFDAAGVVRAVGKDVTRFKVGDEVYFAGVIGRQGTHADFAVVDERIAGPKPKKMGFEDAATVPLTALTAYEGLVEALGIPEAKQGAKVADKDKKTLLIVGGAGGVGSFAVQLAKKALGLRVVATASRPETIKWCKELGADVVINHHKPYAEQLKAAGIADGLVDYAFNTADLGATDQVASVMRPLGKVLAITFPAAASKPVDLTPFLFKRLSLHFELMFTRALDNVEPEKQNGVLTRVAELLDAGVLRSTRQTTLPFDLEGVKEAFKLQQSGKSIGKIVLFGKRK